MSNYTRPLTSNGSMSYTNERADTQERALTQHLAYWKKQLSPPSEFPYLPLDHLQPVVKSKHRSQIAFMLTQDLSKEIREFSRSKQVTLYGCLLTSFQALLHSYTGQTDMLLASPMTFCRTEQCHISVLQNTLVLRADLARNPTFNELLERVHRVIAQARAHHEIPYDMQVQQIESTREESPRPASRVAFSLESSLPVLLPGWTTSRAGVNPARTEFDLSLVIDNRLEGLNGYFEYNIDLFQPTTIERMQGNWQTLLTSMIRNPTQRLSDVTPI